MKRKAPERINKYAAKIDGSVIGKRYDATKDLSVGKQKPYFASAEKLEKVVKLLVNGEPVFLQHFYIAYGEELAKKTTRGERSIVYTKWLSRGLDGGKLRAISHVLTSDEPTGLKMYEYDLAGGLSTWQFFGIDWLGQTFTVGTVGLNENHNSYSIKLLLKRVGSPGLITVSLQEVDGANKPDGIDLCLGTTNGNTLTAAVGGEWREIFLTSYELQKNTMYGIVVRALGGDAANKVIAHFLGAVSSYAGGNLVNSPDSGVNWNIAANSDFMFEEWGIGPQ